MLNQTALIIMNRNRLPIHAVVDTQDPNPENVQEEPDEEESGEPGTLIEALQAALFGQWRFQKKPGGSRANPGTAALSTARSPRQDGVQQTDGRPVKTDLLQLQERRPPRRAMS